MSGYLIYGRIIVPSDFPGGRAGYVNNCIQNNVVSVLTDNGEYYPNCPVLYPRISDGDGIRYALEYPVDGEILGGIVVMGKLKGSSKPIVLGMIGRRNSPNILSEEGQTLIDGAWTNENGETSSYGIDARSNSGSIRIFTTGEKSGDGKLSFTATNANGDAEISLTADILKWTSLADSEFEFGGDHIVNGYGDQGVYFRGAGDYLFDDDFQLDATEIRLGANSQQWALKGEDTISLIEDFIGVTNDMATTLSTATMITPSGTGTFDPGVTAQLQAQSAQLQALSAQLQSLLSQKVKIQ